MFLGFANFYRWFICHFSKIARPLSDLLKGKKTFVFTPEAKRSFEELKNAFMHAPLLRHYDPILPICVEPDASSFALGVILTQCPLEETAQ